MGFFPGREEELPIVNRLALKKTKQPEKKEEEKPQKVREVFSGTVYENQDVGNDQAYRFELTSLMLSDVVISVEDQDVLFGNTKNQRFKVAAGGNLSFTKLDISTLFFKNKTAGSNGKTTVIGTVD